MASDSECVIRACLQSGAMLAHASLALPCPCFFGGGVNGSSGAAGLLATEAGTLGRFSGEDPGLHELSGCCVPTRPAWQLGKGTDRSAGCTGTLVRGCSFFFALPLMSAGLAQATS